MVWFVICTKNLKFSVVDIVGRCANFNTDHGIIWLKSTGGGISIIAVLYIELP